MPTLTIDNRPVTVPDGTKVITAAEQLGIMIPRFCYHPALGSVGACRVCAVGFKEGPIKGVEMSCMVDAQEGMVVATDDPDAVDLRKHVIELLMLHHPHDCPVCDEGGHCLLQDMTISGGHGRRRYAGAKRTHLDQDLGPLVQHEMNRCIQCYRCSRFYQQFCGYRDLGVTGIGTRVYFGRSEPGTLESPFSGNLTDICPTGVYTDKPSRFYGRRWDYERAPSVCIHCSLGCSLTVSARYRKAVRHEARFNAQVNGHFICDRGRYAYAYASQPERPRDALIAGRPATLAQAATQMSERLAAIEKGTGPDGIALMGSARSSLETQALLARLHSEKGWRTPCFSADDAATRVVSSALNTLNATNTIALTEIEGADTVLLVGADPIGEAPMLALALRQAQRDGARIITVDPRPVTLPCAHDHIAVSGDDLATAVAHLIIGALEPSREIALDADQQDRFKTLKQETRDIPAAAELRAIGHALTTAWRPAFVCGTTVPGPDVPPLMGLLQALVQTSCMWSGLFFPLPGANTFGAHCLGGSDALFEPLLAAVEAGQVKALVVVENDLFSEYPDQQRLAAALESLELLVVMDCVPSAITARADIFLPTQTIYEAGGHYLNNEGRLQVATPVIAGGLSIMDTGGGNHPPREFREDIPGGTPRPAWQYVAGLATGETDPPDVKPLLDEALTAGVADGERVSLPSASREWPSIERIGAGPEGDAGGLTLIESAATFGSEPLAAFSTVLAELTPLFGVTVHSETAQRLGWRAGDRIVIPDSAPALEVVVTLDDRAAPGVLLVPRRIGIDRTALRRYMAHLLAE